MNTNNKTSFSTLLLIVIGIGILLSFVMVVFHRNQNNALNIERKISLKNISVGLKSIYGSEGMYPEGKCVSDIEGKLKNIIGKVPKDPKYNITYGTKENGCKDGSFGYTPLEVDGISQNGFLLLANIDPGKGGNYVLNYNQNIFKPVSEKDIVKKEINKNSLIKVSFGPYGRTYIYKPLITFNDKQNLKDIQNGICNEIEFLKYKPENNGGIIIKKCDKNNKIGKLLYNLVPYYGAYVLYGK